MFGRSEPTRPTDTQFLSLMESIELLKICQSTGFEVLKLSKGRSGIPYLMGHAHDGGQGDEAPSEDGFEREVDDADEAAQPTEDAVQEADEGKNGHEAACDVGHEEDGRDRTLGGCVQDVGLGSGLDADGGRGGLALLGF